MLDHAALHVTVATPADRARALAILLEGDERKRQHGFRVWGAEELAATVQSAVPCGELYLAVLDGVAVGVYRLQCSDPEMWGERPADAGYVHKLAVAEGATGHDVGVGMLRAAADQVRAASRPYLRLDCEAANQWLNDYYRRAGFTLTGSRRFPDGFEASLFERAV